MTKDIQYQKRFWNVRWEIKQKGVKQPVNEMIKRKMITPNDSFSENTNYLQGRTDSYEFLEKLEILNEALKYE